MDACPTCQTPIAKNLADLIRLGEEKCPKSIKDYAPVTRISDVSPDLQASMDWFYGTLWNTIFEDEPLMQVKAPEAPPANLVSWEEFQESMDTLFGADNTVKITPSKTNKKDD